MNIWSVFSRLGALTLIAILLSLLATSALAQSPPGLSVQFTNGQAQLTATGDAGSPLTLQYSTNLSASNTWVPLTNYTLLTNSPPVLDPAAPSIQRFYRAVIIVPTNMIWIPAGTFAMGSPTNEADRNPDETQHSVTLTTGFYIGKFLITQGAYLSVMNTNPSYFTTNDNLQPDLTRPVEQVKLYDASNYCAVLTQQAQLAGQIFTNWVYRLPTEAEWEYACRAGTTTPFYLGADLRSGMANFDGEYEYIGGTGTVLNTNGIVLNRTTSVGLYASNPASLFDMAGNVWEWCQDWYTNYPTGAVIDPQGPGTGTERVFRGGALNATGAECRSANRNNYDPTGAFNTLGFRLVLAPGP